MFAGVHAALTPALAQVFKSVKTTPPLFIEMGLEDLTSQFGSLVTVAGNCVGELVRVELGGKTELIFCLSEQNTYLWPTEYQFHYI